MWFFGLIVVLLIGAVAVVASGRWGAMSPAYDDRPDMTVPARQALTSAEIESVRFAVGLRGYRMDEVDTLLERVAREVAERDRRIADLERAVAPILDSPDGDGFASRARYTAADFDDTGSHQPILVGGDFPPADNTADPSADEAATPDSATASASAPAPDSASAPASAPASDSAMAPAPGSGTASGPGSATAPTAVPVAAAPGFTMPAVAVPAAQEPPATESQQAAESAPHPTTEAAPQPTDEPVAEADPQSATTEPAPPTAASDAANDYERAQAEARALLEATTGSLPTIRPASEHTTEPTEQSAPQAPDALSSQPAQQAAPDAWFHESPAHQPSAPPEQPAPVPGQFEPEPAPFQQPAAPQQAASAPEQFEGQAPTGSVAYQQQGQPSAYQQSQGQSAAYQQPAQPTPNQQSAEPTPYQQAVAPQQQPTQQSADQPAPYQQPAVPGQQAAPVPHWVQRPGAEQEQEGWEAWEPPAADGGAQGRHSAPPEQPAYRRPS
ncbi:DivIVA domain-containing protein [Kribbella sp. NBC_01505]|uniref:DivIVA domain-containing protein n=1 Tax=Kribbella sp. NBC_01505 TaxID=2903580 RepID=UPI003869A640